MPPSYLRASEAQRVELLRGLMDSDGHIYATGRAEFTSTVEQLAEGALELILSLGMKGTLRRSDASAHQTRSQDAFRVQFSPTLCVTSLPRKAETAVEHIQRRAGKRLSKVRQRYIKAVQDAGPAQVTCLAVDSPSGMVVVGQQMLPVRTAHGWLL